MKSGYYWIPGRADDVLNVSGHRLKNVEIKGAGRSAQGKVAEAAWGILMKEKAEGIHAFVTLTSGQSINQTDAVKLKIKLKK